MDAALHAIAAQKDTSDLTPVSKVLQVVESTLNVLADSVLKEQPPVRRNKLEHLVSLGGQFAGCPPGRRNRQEHLGQFCELT